MQWIIDNYALISALLPIVYTLFNRLFPSEKDLDLINAIKKALDFILPNIKKGGGFH